MHGRRRLELVIATHNQGKIREVQKALEGLPLQFRYLSEFAHVSAVPELGKTYEDNAVLKAMGYAKQTRVCALADDSGLEVDALDGRPGVFSARFGGASASDADRIQALLSQLAEQRQSDRTARFVCCMALAGWDSAHTAKQDEPHLLTVTEARCEGAIAYAPRGENGFGFDPVFLPAGYQETFGELPNEVKASISHRAQALAKIRTFINSWLATA
ncbi:MAG TPA: RdgB/HAM1 family non-canonical purine NTP pyrophosphatase [Pyrinomonadaceae bacterium]|nr:RdgB/HAM1 family non-canonical purine NTP pyrophosphatase [Pyrinomonadaceae bacterium]